MRELKVTLQVDWPSLDPSSPSQSAHSAQCLTCPDGSRLRIQLQMMYLPRTLDDLHLRLHFAFRVRKLVRSFFAHHSWRRFLMRAESTFFPFRSQRDEFKTHRLFLLGEVSAWKETRIGSGKA